MTRYVYDFRNRLVDTDGELEAFERLCLDNLGRVVQRERYNTTGYGTLNARSRLKYDDRGRVFQTIRYEVDPITGAVGNALTDNAWHDAAGNVIKTLPLGSKRFTKTTFDGLGRPTVAYTGYDLGETSYADAGSVANDVILEQVETTNDAAGNVILTTTRQRYHNAPATQTGALQNPTTAPKARVTYVAAYPDALGRIVATADYGTNGGVAFTRSATIPARSDTVLVSSVEYDDAGNVLQTTDPKGKVTRFEYDQRGRDLKLTEDYGDKNRVTRKTYTADGLLKTLVAENADTGDQTTTYTYGTTLSDSDIATSTLLRTETLPTGGGDTKTYSYNRQGEVTTITDQRGSVRTLERDLLGRLTQDRVTTLGSGVDGAVQRLEATFNGRGLPETLSSYDNPTVGSGSVVNQVELVYNGFDQVAADYQSHSGVVSANSSPKVQLMYASGSANTIRPTGLTYPDGRVLSYSYGAANGIDDACSRVAALIDDDGASTHLAEYSFLGLSATVVVDFTEPDVKYTLVDLSGTNDPDTGDIYSGLDRFGRVKDCRWYNYGSSSDTARLKYGYDRASNRLWREDSVAVSQSKNFDELYSYDGLHRLSDMKRGRLNSGHTALTTTTFTQAWTLDATGNWPVFQEAATGGSLTLDQTRTANTVNEITGITNSIGSAWSNPAHDAAGNMTTIPQPADPTTSFTATYDAWNRLVKLTASGQTVQENQYDARTFRTVEKSSSSSGSGSSSSSSGSATLTTRHFYYTPGWRCIEERLGSTPNSATPDRQYVWGNRYIDDLVCRDRSVSGSLDERLYANQDANWNVVSLIDTTSTVQERYAYSPYGIVNVLTAAFVVRATSSYDWETTYCGYRFDANSGQLAVRNRFYHPLLGRWTTRDPIGYADGTNLYMAYFAPNGIDPSGLLESQERWKPGAWSAWGINPNPYDPWYDNDWTDWINPFAYSAQVGADLGGLVYLGNLDQYHNQAAYLEIQGNSFLALAENQIDANQARSSRIRGIQSGLGELAEDAEIAANAGRAAVQVTLDVALMGAPLTGCVGRGGRSLPRPKIPKKPGFWSKVPPEAAREWADSRGLDLMEPSPAVQNFLSNLPREEQQPYWNLFSHLHSKGRDEAYLLRPLSGIKSKTTYLRVERGNLRRSGCEIRVDLYDPRTGAVMPSP